MGVVRHHNRALLSAFALLLFASSAATLGKMSLINSGGGSDPISRVVVDEKRGGGPGSFPPSCRSKCHKCFPCYPVHVPIQPGFSVALEYYPEAWRCKCGNKLFMP